MSAATDFQRLMLLTDAVHRRQPPAPDPLPFAQDTALLDRAQAVFADQGLAVDRATLQAAAAEVDHASRTQEGAPIVPLPVAAKAFQPAWWHRRAYQRAHQAALAREWDAVFNRVRQERLDAHAGPHVNLSPVSPAHAHALTHLWTKGVHPAQVVPYRLAFKKEGQEHAHFARMPIDPVLHCLRAALNYYADPQALRQVDGGLCRFLVAHGAPGLHARYSEQQWWFHSNFFKKWHKHISPAELMARQLRISMLEALQVSWPPARTWKESVLWFVLIHPLRVYNHGERALQHDVWTQPSWTESLEATVRYVLVHETDSAEHHARVLREAIALQHEHADWLKPWLPEYATAAPSARMTG